MKKFYDIHMHALDLSHPNLSAFLFKADLFSSMINWKLRLKTLLVPILSILPDRIIANQVKKIFDENPFIKNTLSFYETPIEYQFLLVDYFLKNPSSIQDCMVTAQNELSFDGETYNKIVLCPLTIDFGYKNLNEDGVFYNKAPYKPIAKQLGDLFYSIYTYYRFELVPDNNPRKLQLQEINKPFEEIKQEKLFEIYPFMGLNTQNYPLEKLKGTATKIGLLEKYFSNFKHSDTATVRQKRLYDKMGVFNGKMYENDESIYKDIFAGIKVYPQLGFDPYPEDEAELAKVEFLYNYCIQKRIPIMSHCSDGGFKVGNFDNYTNPQTKWKQVIEKFPKLTLCFAHFGSQQTGKKDWRKAIIELAKYDNVFTDISCNNSTKNYYKELNKTINNANHLKDKIMYGSDFSINMFASKVSSYNSYLKTFIDAVPLDTKIELAVHNPENFLFGGRIETTV